MKAIQDKERYFISISPSHNKGLGFTLVELIVVIAIIIIVASLAVPVTLRARVQANEAAAIGNLRTVSSAAEAFRTSKNPPAYAVNLDEMMTSQPPYLDSTWSNTQRQGYVYSYASSTDGERFSLSGTPRVPNVSGVNSYCVDHTGIIQSYTQGGSIGSDIGCEPGGKAI